MNGRKNQGEIVVIVIGEVTKESTNLLTLFATAYTKMQLRSEEIRKVGRQVIVTIKCLTGYLHNIVNYLLMDRTVITS